MKLTEIEAAARRLTGIVHQTPLIASSTFSGMTGAELHLKCENLQKTGSFKVRGAYNKIALLTKGGDTPAIVCSSAGNHAQGVAYAAAALGARATVVMPRTAPIAKIAATKSYGAEVVLSGTGYDDAYERACEIQKEQNAVFVHAFDEEDVIAGQGTISLEILSALPTVDAILVPAGGGGLLAGMAACIKQVNPRVRIFGVQAENADAIVRSFHASSIVATDSAATIADGIAVRKPGDITVPLIRAHVDDMLTASDDAIAEAILLLLERAKMVVEPAGATALAAALSGIPELAGKRVVCLLSGGNIDVGFIHKVVERGLVSRGRQIRLRTVIGDVPGNLQKICAIVSKCGANILDVQHDRLHTGLHLGETMLRLTCEVGGRDHGGQLVEELEKSGYKILVES